VQAKLDFAYDRLSILRTPQQTAKLRIFRQVICPTRLGKNFCFIPRSLGETVLMRRPVSDVVIGLESQLLLIGLPEGNIGSMTEPLSSTADARNGRSSLCDLLLDFCERAQLQPGAQIGAKLSAACQKNSSVLERRTDASVSEPDFGHRSQIR
jgi:hypothetical protein